eukprot:TRINITY_DN14773_c0_g1_i1.p1 TRINITY_DN14773_c0_g1~~TRINITY_DN14773_c0_g1_i1.p1  ORF type:complete len:183 (+),score=48.17 TRINITY_DN14773_c0_g1_i1:84-632(+)
MSAPAESGGHGVILASRRPDGTFRKERKVRAGFVQQDEMTSYVSLGTKFEREVAARGVMGSGPAQTVHKKEAQPQTRAAKKNAARKAKRAQEIASGGGGDCSSVQGVTDKMGQASVSAGGGGGSGGGVDTEKKLKALRKKLRMIDQLQEKIDNGGVKPNEAQVEKLSKKAEVEADIKKLESL